MSKQTGPKQSAPRPVAGKQTTPKQAALKRAVFLDRDGTIMRDRGYLKDPEGVELLPGVVDSLKALCREGWKLIIVSNQSGVGRGLMTVDEMNAVHARLIRLLRGHGIEIAASYLCTHSPDDECECRKPGIASLEKASVEHSVDISQSWIVGDRESDILCGRNAACTTIWFNTGEFDVASELPDYVAESWAEIYEKISDA